MPNLNPPPNRRDSERAEARAAEAEERARLAERRAAKWDLVRKYGISREDADLIPEDVNDAMHQKFAARLGYMRHADISTKSGLPGPANIDLGMHAGKERYENQQPTFLEPKEKDHAQIARMIDQKARQGK